MAARKIPDRVCVIVGRQKWQPFAGACRSREHGHMTGAKAAQMVENGSAAWVSTTWTDVRGKEHKRSEPCIELVGRKRWKGVLSGRGSAAPMKVMQLVAG